MYVSAVYGIRCALNRTTMTMMMMIVLIAMLMKVVMSSGCGVCEGKPEVGSLASANCLSYFTLNFVYSFRSVRAKLMACKLRRLAPPGQHPASQATWLLTYVRAYPFEQMHSHGYRKHGNCFQQLYYASELI